MWDERYAQEGFAYGTEPNGFLEAHASALPDGPVLCLSDGEGRNGVFLAQRGHAVTSVDLSEVGLAKARQLAAERGVSITTVVADLATWELGEARWSGVVSISAHLPPEVRARVHGAVVRALRPGGVLLLEAYAPSQLGRGTGGPPARDWLFDVEQVKGELEGLDFELAHETERDVVEGRYHTGRAAVTQIIARKP